MKKQTRAASKAVRRKTTARREHRAARPARARLRSAQYGERTLVRSAATRGFSFVYGQRDESQIERFAGVVADADDLLVDPFDDHLVTSRLGDVAVAVTERRLAEADVREHGDGTAPEPVMEIVRALRRRVQVRAIPAVGLVVAEGSVGGADLVHDRRIALVAPVVARGIAAKASAARDRHQNQSESSADDGAPPQVPRCTGPRAPVEDLEAHRTRREPSPGRDVKPTTPPTPRDRWRIRGDVGKNGHGSRQGLAGRRRAWRPGADHGAWSGSARACRGRAGGRARAPGAARALPRCRYSTSRQALPGREHAAGRD